MPLPPQGTARCRQGARPSMKNVQGILPLNGDVYVTGEGPQGNGLYCLSDQDRDGTLEAVRLLFNFEGEMGEQTAHGLVLGPDGWIYVVLGVYTSPLKDYDPASPHRGYYEGDLVGPRYEDPGGHAVGRKAPGGMIIRTDLNGEVVQLVAGGLRNVYDLAFSPEGELFIHDSDMESDIGTTWYRPTRLCHVLPGGEYGWRSGWANWPEYYVDLLPSIADTGRSSPTGAVFYNHVMFPEQYRNALFLGDWSEGRILVAHLKPNGASYTASVETFLSGQPLNVTDLDVGPDGWLYFVTGGRGTGGGLYRVTWTGHVPENVTDLGAGIAPAIRQPQLSSAWGRQRVAKVQQSLGEDWGPMLLGVARSTANPTHYRTRALDLMQLYGPTPSVALLLELSRDKNEIIRAKAAELMGLYASDETRERLLDLFEDSDRFVRRKAMEAVVRAEQQAPPDTVIPLLASDDRFEAWAARRLLEVSPVEQWRDTVLNSDQQRIFIQGALALLIAQPSRENAFAVLERSSKLMTDFVSDRDFIDMLRSHTSGHAAGPHRARANGNLARATRRRVPGRRSAHEPRTDPPPGVSPGFVDHGPVLRVPQLRCLPPGQDACRHVPAVSHRRVGPSNARKSGSNSSHRPRPGTAAAAIRCTWATRHAISPGN